MRYFKPFPLIEYKFGTDMDQDLIQNIALYSDVIDQTRNSTTTYEDYYIIADTRPDQVSFEIYDTPEYHWTFFLMNNKLRERGWPLSNNKMFEKAKALYPHRVLTTTTRIHNTFKIGQTVTGLTSGATGVVMHRVLDIGHIYLKNVTGTFAQSENITSVVSGVTETAVITASEVQYNAAHHYENADGEVVDIDPTVGPGALLTEVTWLDRLSKQNEELRQIRIIKPELVEVIVESYKESVE